jgi:hypothetical protein
MGKTLILITINTMENQNTITVTMVLGNGIVRSVGMTPRQFAKYDDLMYTARDIETIEGHDAYVEAIEFFNDLYCS